MEANGTARGWPLAICSRCPIIDGKAVTDALVEQLHPRHAVISCGRNYIPEKDRPSGATISRLRGCGAKIWYTDAFDDGVQPPRSWPFVEFSICKDGEIIEPE